MASIAASTLLGLPALVSLALLVLGITGVIAYAVDARRRDSQHSRETQFLSESFLELSRQRAGRGTPPAGVALPPTTAGVGAAHGDRCTACGLEVQDWHVDGECVLEPHRLTDDRFSRVVMARA